MLLEAAGEVSFFATLSWTQPTVPARKSAQTMGDALRILIIGGALQPRPPNNHRPPATEVPWGFGPNLIFRPLRSRRELHWNSQSSLSANPRRVGCPRNPRQRLPRSRLATPPHRAQSG